MCLALGTDIRIASKTAKMGLTFVQLGIHPGMLFVVNCSYLSCVGMGATHFLPKLVGNQVAARLLLTGDLIEGMCAIDALSYEIYLPQARRLRN